MTFNHIQYQGKKRSPWLWLHLHLFWSFNPCGLFAGFALNLQLLITKDTGQNRWIHGKFHDWAKFTIIPKPELNRFPLHFTTIFQGFSLPFPAGFKGRRAWRAPRWWALEKVTSVFKYGQFWYLGGIFYGLLQSKNDLSKFKSYKSKSTACTTAEGRTPKQPLFRCIKPCK